ncbi:c-type cytochrome [Pareuzebyella sediminis]|uniref:c-type cytochrome n=1 Tax=Pareuzebyella sediminis TaxID=2607998 RepID=UPI0011EFA3FA|nr:c-type cytochrome [Pareuzebyella sediminis]
MRNLKIISAAVFCAATFFFLGCKKEKSEMALLEEEKQIDFNLPDNFELEDLYHPSAHGQGSWVALAQGPGETMFSCDQYGKIYQFKIPSEGDVLKPDDVDSLSIDIGEAHGLLWAFNSLYVAVNKNWDDDVPDEDEKGSGIYRVIDSDNDGKLDKVNMLLKLEGAGEHGPHSFVLSPDEKEIYFIAGNHTLIPESLLTNSRLPINWDEDNLFKPYLDARGHANEVKAPGGWITKFNPEGTQWELISAGYRNAFDMAFNPEGELFAYDADMEWDIGMPWYRPTRILHVTSGSEYGWRTGSGKWPEYYADALPAVHNLEQGSPTAVLSGAALNFPSKYKNGLLIVDWSFGTIYFIDLKEQGSSYTADREEFLSGTPLPLTDMIAGYDGNLYFASGGRRTNSHLFRLRYTGTEESSSEKPVSKEASKLRELRHTIEKYHSTQSEAGVTLAWENLGHEDRYIRYASRVALEYQPLVQWTELFQAERDPLTIIEASIALAHQGDSSIQSMILSKLNPIVLETLPKEQQLALLRAYELVFIRMGQPNPTDRSATIRKLKRYFPHADNDMNRELGQLLLYLKAEGTTQALVDLLKRHTEQKTAETDNLLPEETSMRSEQYGPLIREIIAKMPPSEAIYYGVLLSHADQGWTKELREDYFNWFYDVLNAQGGLSFKAGIENVRLEAMTHVPEREKEYFQELTGVYSPSTAVADLPQPIGPGKAYSGRDLNKMLWGGGMSNFEGDFEDGERAFKAGMCIMCHRMRGEGGAAGPDLTQAHTKFNSYEMLYAIFSPNDEISDQYAHTLFHLKDDKKISGRLLSEEGDSVNVAPNPFNETYTVRLAKSDITKREPSPISPMPSGLLNRLNENEILALMHYLEAGGDPDHEIYSKKNANP